MRYLLRHSKLAICLLVFQFVLAQRAYAYIDPGSGSYILQLLLAGLFGAIFAIKIFWGKLKSFFSTFFDRFKTKSG